MRDYQTSGTNQREGITSDTMKQSRQGKYLVSDGHGTIISITYNITNINNSDRHKSNISTSPILSVRIALINI